MSTLIDPWIDVLAATVATLAPGGLGGPPVVIHEGLRVMPLLVAGQRGLGSPRAGAVPRLRHRAARPAGPA